MSPAGDLGAGDRERFALGDAENRRIFDQRIAPTEFAGIVGVAHPGVHFFGGQPGAGKSVMQAGATTALVSADGPASVLSIIGDDFRAHHPEFARLLIDDDEAAAFYTDLDSGRWVEQAIAWAVRRRPHAVLEGTLRRPAVTLRSASQFLDAGFAAHLHVVAAHRFVSRTRIFGRYVDQLGRHGHGRYTLPDAHDASYDRLPSAVSELADAGSFETITVYSALGDVIVAVSRDEAGEAAAEAVRSVHSTPPPAAVREELLGLLDGYADALAQHGKSAALRDLEALRLEIETSHR